MSRVCECPYPRTWTDPQTNDRLCDYCDGTVADDHDHYLTRSTDES